MEQHMLVVDRNSDYSVMEPLLVVGEVNHALHLLDLFPHYRPIQRYTVSFLSPFHSTLRWQTRRREFHG
jgi:hypothetical protein